MPWGTGIGTGLREPCPPYREVVFLGAPLNSVSADEWNCHPQITGAFTELDLTYSAINCEACVALITQPNAFAGTYLITFRWYKDPRTVPFFTFSFTRTADAGGWFYGYSFVGWTPLEISENGKYWVDVNVSGPMVYGLSIPFTVKGITIPPPPPPPEPPETNTIVEAFESIANTMLEVYETTKGWIWPFQLISNPFYWLYTFFHTLASLFGQFLDWVTALADQIKNVLSWESIKNLILSWLPGLDSLIAWFSDWKNKVWGAVEFWWEEISTTVLGWIDAAVEGLSDLKAAWDNFWTVTFPTLVSFDWLATWWGSQLPGIQSLIYSTLKTWFPFYDELASLWGEIRAFFADPLQWVYNKLDEFFERFW